MKIEIDLADLGVHYDPDGDPIGNRTLEDAIIQAAAGLIVTKAGKDITAAARDVVAEQVKDQVGAIVATVIAEPIQRTSTWGEPKGEPVTLKDMIRERLEKWLSEPPRRRDGYSNTQQTVGTLSELVDQEVATIMSKDMRDAIASVKANMVNEIKTKAMTAAINAMKI